MSSTHLSLHIHVIFGTKDQRPLIEPAWRSRLHAYLGGAADHIHMLIGLRATHQLADVMRDIKRTLQRGSMKPSAKDYFNGRTVTALLP